MKHLVIIWPENLPDAVIVLTMTARIPFTGSTLSWVKMTGDGMVVTGGVVVGVVGVEAEAGVCCCWLSSWFVTASRSTLELHSEDDPKKRDS